ncbi:subtilisin-like protease SBT2.4 [Impatiens glandulifera]|uniref:subtilisin-like protease SBT2.4 n=1 Tax=Impatiens glandulifera TaxID=253017 RepID=UPI001FB08846|nr:subtilisin-like protease SBT2.4 [Impatiens glandulifera]
MQFLLVFLIFIPCMIINTTRTLAKKEDRKTYLVIMKDNPPVAFHPGLELDSLKQGFKKLNPNSEACRAHAEYLVNTHDHILHSTLDSGSYTKLYSFKHLINGFSVHTTPDQVKKMKGVGKVKLVEKDRGAKLMTTYTPEFLGLHKGIWTQEGGERNDGEGVVIGVIDTGINYRHPSFSYDPLNPFPSNLSHFNGGCEQGARFPANACNGKIVSARFFSAGAKVNAVLDPSMDFLSPFDAVGHGSHVASIAAGNYRVPVVVDGTYYGQASGMAPRARIAVYKAIFPTIGTMTDVVAAIDQAAMDGVDILTLSVGPDETHEGDTLTYMNVFDLFMLSARRAGVFVVQAAGNNGPIPYSVLSYSPWAVGVGACRTDRTYPGTLILGNGRTIEGIGLSGANLGNGLLKYKLILAKDAINPNGSFQKTAEYIEECQFPEAFDPVLVQGSVVICTFSQGFYNQTSSMTAIINTATNLGFEGFVFLANPSLGDFVAEPLPFSVPGIMIPKTDDAKIIMEYYEWETMRDENRGIRFGGRAAIGEGRAASFGGNRGATVLRSSSRGPDFINSKRTPADVLKPDILAPGHQIWGAWSPVSLFEPIYSGNNFALLTGTSMAAPHIAGIAALIKQNHPSWTPSMIASAMSTTASTHDSTGEHIMAEGSKLYSFYKSSSFDIGAGLVNPSLAIDPGLVFTSGYDDYVNFLCSHPNTDPDMVRTATGGTCGSFGNPSDLNLPSVTMTRLVDFAIVKRSVKNVGGKVETYMCAISHPKGVKVKVKPSVFRIEPLRSQRLEIRLKVTKKMEGFRFGEIVLIGSLNHIVRIPLSLLSQ